MLWAAFRRDFSKRRFLTQIDGPSEWLQRVVETGLE